MATSTTAQKPTFVAGKITGSPKSEIKEKFESKSKELKGLGRTAIVMPVAIHEQEKMSFPEALRKDIVRLMDCGCLCLLHDWTESLEATLLRDIAIRLNDMDIVYS